MNCPLCQVTLRMAERQGVEINDCPRCRGVWLDRVKLDEIIERSRARLDDEENEEHGRDERRRDSGEHGRDERRWDSGEHDRNEAAPRKKRRSFFENFFDSD